MPNECVRCGDKIDELMSFQELSQLPPSSPNKYRPARLHGVSTNIGPVCRADIATYRENLYKVAPTIRPQYQSPLTNGSIRKKIASVFLGNGNGSQEPGIKKLSASHVNGFDIVRASSGAVTKSPKRLKPGETDDRIRLPLDPHSNPSLNERLRNLRGSCLSELEQFEI